jgi:hypothetical protein
MDRRRGPTALACLLAAACSSKDEAGPPPDTTPPAIANEVTREVGVRDVLRVVFTEPVALTPGTAVKVTSALHGEVPATITLRTSGVIEAAPEAPLTAPDTVTITVSNVVDGAGNALVRGAARFVLPTWQEVGEGPPMPEPVPWLLRPSLALDGDVPVLDWGGGQARLRGNSWQEGPPGAGGAYLVTVPGAAPLQAVCRDDHVRLELLPVSGTPPTALVDVSGTPPFTCRAAARFAASAYDALLVWDEGDGGPVGVHAIRNSSWIHEATLPMGAGGSPVHSRAAAVSPSGIAYIAVVEDPSAFTPARARVYASGAGDLTFVPIGPDVDNADANDLAVDAAGVLYLATIEGGGRLRVRSWGSSGWVDLGSPNLGFPNMTIDGGLAIDPDGAPLATYDEHVSDAEVRRSTVQVRRWNGAAWDAVGEPVEGVANWAASPRLAVDSSGHIYLTYQESTGTYPTAAPPWPSFQVRVKRLNR